MTHEKIVGMIRTATTDVFGTMLGIELEEQPDYIEEIQSGPSEGVMALIGLAGQWVGSGTFSCSAPAAQKISGAMLMQEFAAIDDDVLDAIGEITNMVLGNVKTALEEEFGPMGLSIPTVVYGIGKSQWHVVPFRFGEEVLKVRLFITPNKDATPRSLSARDQQAPAFTIPE
jgi:chemotaxis protein CheX